MVIGAVFVFAGVMHFVNPDIYLEMMPDWIPLHGPAVFWSGVAEVAGGLALFFDRTARIWDIHHGNGIQRIFESDPSVLYFSVHR